MTIRELLVRWTENRLRKLKEGRAPQVVIDAEEAYHKSIPNLFSEQKSSMAVLADTPIEEFPLSKMQEDFVEGGVEFKPMLKAWGVRAGGMDNDRYFSLYGPNEPVCEMHVFKLKGIPDEVVLLGRHTILFLKDLSFEKHVEPRLLGM